MDFYNRHYRIFGFAIFVPILLAFFLFSISAYAGQIEDCEAAYVYAGSGHEDHGSALNICLPLAQQGDAEAQYRLYLMYRNGYGVGRNEAESLKWSGLVRQAAERGDAKAEYAMGRMSDQVEAVKWYRLSAEQGHAKAQFELGLAYRVGRGVPRDAVESAKWYGKAADQGYPHTRLWGLLALRLVH